MTTCTIFPTAARLSSENTKAANWPFRIGGKCFDHGVGKYLRSLRCISGRWNLHGIGTKRDNVCSIGISQGPETPLNAYRLLHRCLIGLSATTYEREAGWL